MAINRAPATFTPATSSHLKTALTLAMPGDVITLLPIIYEGDFLLTEPTPRDDIKMTSGHITLRGTVNQKKKSQMTIIIPTPTGTGIAILGNQPWHISDLSIKCSSPASTGVTITGQGHVLDLLTITGGRGGISVDGDRNTLTFINISDSAQGIVIKGVGNVLRRIFLQRIIHFGIIVEGGSQGTRIKDTGGAMSIQGGPSLTLKEGSNGTTLSDVSLNGILNACADRTRVKKGYFCDVNLIGNGNSFKATIIGRLYQKPGTHRNRLDFKTTIAQHSYTLFK